MTFRSLSRRRFLGATAALSLTSVAPDSRASAQDLALSCEPLNAGTPAASPAAAVEPVEIPTFDVPDGAIEINIGFLPIGIYAPIFVALDKGYYAEYGLDVRSSAINSGTDIAVLTATNDLQIGLSGVGPAFWNGIDADLPLAIIAPGHEEGSPVATPLMISKQACDEQTITSVADLAGKRVSVNAPGATEFWLNAALSTGDLTIEDVDLQFLAFPDAVTALDSGALDAAMVGEPLATQAEQQGLAVRLASDFPVQGFQVTAVYANQQWIDDNPDAAAGFIAGYIRACRDLMEAPNDPLNLTIINKWTSVPIQLIADSVKPQYQVNGDIHHDNLVTLQEFFANRGLLEFDGTIDPATVIEQSVIDNALALLDGI